MARIVTFLVWPRVANSREFDLPETWRWNETKRAEAVFGTLQQSVELDSSEAKLFETLLAWKRSHPGGASPDATVADPVSEAGGVDRLRRRQVHLPKVERQQVVELYRDGVPVNEIAERFGVHRKTVREIAKAVGLEPRPRGLLPDQVGRAAALYESGWSLARVGDEFGLDAWCVRKAIVTQGVAIRARQGGRQKA